MERHMTELSSLFYGLKRSALAFSGASLLLCLHVLHPESEVFGVRLSSEHGGMFLWLLFLCSIFFSASFFWTAFIDARRLLPKQMSEMLTHEQLLEEIVGQIRDSTHKLNFRPDIRISKSDITTALSDHSGADALLSSWTKRTGWSDGKFSLNEEVRSRIEKAVSQALHEAINMSPVGALINESGFTDELRNESLRAFSRALESGSSGLIQKEIQLQARETIDYFDSLAERGFDRLEALSQAVKHQSDLIEPTLKRMDSLANQLRDTSRYFATTRNALSLRFLITDVGAVGLLALLNVLHFAGLWWHPLGKSVFAMLPTP